MNANFTIVTPNYNMGEYLAETIESVLVNLRPGDEYFIIDGGSTDSSLEVIRKYESRITGWVSGPDKGYADALYKGFNLAGGEYLCWINCGDLLLEGTLERARELFDSRDADMIFGDDYYIDEAGKVIFRSCGKVHSLQNMMLYGGWTPLQDACFWKRDLYNQVGGLDVSLKYAADYDLFLRMSMAGRCDYVSFVFSAFRRHEGQKSIHGQLEYKRERYQCRAVAMGKSRRHLMVRRFLALYYWFAVRIRSRVSNYLLQSTQRSGESVRNLKCSA